MDKKLLAVLILVIVIIPFFTGCFESEIEKDFPPEITINHPENGETVSNLVIISGTASDLDGNDTIEKIEVKIDDGIWNNAMGITKWSFDWRAYEINDGVHSIYVRSFDGTYFSKIKKIEVEVNNPEVIESDSHKWAIFIAASNFPLENEDKLGNGGLFFAENLASYLVEECSYSTSNVVILFDDGWIREDNGYGPRLETLQQREHEYDFSYGGATKKNVISSLEHIIQQSNNFEDSEVFIWIFSHGCGDPSFPFTGGKILDTSSVFLWDNTLSDQELGDTLTGLNSDKTCIIIDSCYSGGFADKTIYNFPTALLMKSKIPRPGRVIITGASKFRQGYASTTQGPLFSLIWFEGITTGKADGYRPGLFKQGRPTKLKIFKDEKVSVEEAFYYTRYVLKTDEKYKEYNTMQPQLNDQYPYKGFIRSMKGLHLCE